MSGFKALTEHSPINFAVIANMSADGCIAVGREYVIDLAAGGTFIKLIDDLAELHLDVAGFENFPRVTGISADGHTISGTYPAREDSRPVIWVLSDFRRPVSNDVGGVKPPLADAGLTAPPTLKLKLKVRVETEDSSATLKGSAQNIARLEWKVGSKGKVRGKKAGASWQLKVTGLKTGKNVVFVRSVSPTGIKSKFRKIVIVRQ